MKMKSLMVVVALSGMTLSMGGVCEANAAPLPPAGHVDLNLPLIEGAPVTIEVTPEGATVTFHIAGEQQDVVIENEIAANEI